MVPVLTTVAGLFGIFNEFKPTELAILGTFYAIGLPSASKAYFCISLLGLFVLVAKIALVCFI